MTSRRKWSVQEEIELKTLLEGNASVEEIAAKLGKSPGAVVVKCQRLGLPLKVEGYLPNSVRRSREMPSVEEAIRIVAGALKDSTKPGLNKLEVQRLQLVANISKTYKELVVDYAHYHDVEVKLIKMEEENAQLKRTLREISSRSSSIPSQPVSVKME
jgi:hypothetical protein